MDKQALGSTQTHDHGEQAMTHTAGGRIKTEEVDACQRSNCQLGRSSTRTPVTDPALFSRQRA